jgi:single-strand DNA-binding protein
MNFKNHFKQININIMNALRNRVQLIGNLGQNPEVKEFDGGKKVARFSVATTETYRDKDGNQVKDTQWHNLVAWNKNAEIVEKYLEKGKEVAIDGKLTSRSYETKEGVKKYVTEVVVNELLMLGSRK